MKILLGLGLILVLFMASAQGKNNKLLKKIYKSLKMPQDSTYLQDIVDIANNKVNVANNDAAVSSIDSAIVSLSEDVGNNTLNITNLKADVAVNAANIEKNAMDITDHLLGTAKWLIAATGSGSNVVEAINMKDSTASCDSLPPYPLAIRTAKGLMIGDVRMIVGGYISPAISEVYKLDYHGKSWVLLGNMAVARNQFAIAELNGGAWAMGGFTHGSWNFQISTEIIYTNGNILNGPDLPEARARHCAVTLPNGKVVIMGGRTSSSVLTKDVLIYDPSTSTYTSGPDMFYERENFACVHFYSDKHGGRPVILSAGGYLLSKAEIYDYDNGIWEEIPDIPSPYSPHFDGPSALTSLDGKGAFLQHGESFFELTCDTSSCTWSVMEQTLDVGRYGVVMMYLPSDFECN